ncbi:MAG: response regulator [Magnetococcales bacterium]|nr:response regulator [Magnetococcales bacterium]
MRILIIDDDPQFLNMLVWMVESAGHEVVSAHNGDRGLAEFANGDFQLVITDILMPDKDGVETIQSIRTISPKTPIIAMSGGYSQSANSFIGLTVAERLGAYKVLEKPFEKEQLLEAIKIAEDKLSGEQL